MNKKCQGNPAVIGGSIISGIIGIFILIIVLDAFTSAFDSITGKDDLEKQLIEEQNKNNILNGKNNRLQSIVDSNKITIKNKDDRINFLENELNIFNKSYNQLYDSNLEKDNQIENLKDENEDLLNENIKLQNKDVFNVIFQDGNVYYEFLNLTVRKDVVIITNFFF